MAKLEKRLNILGHTLSAEDMWRSYQRQLFNRSHGKKGKWLGAHDRVRVPFWFKRKLKKQYGATPA